jgi:hypothetical protein
MPGDEDDDLKRKDRGDGETGKKNMASIHDWAKKEAELKRKGYTYDDSNGTWSKPGA